MEDKQDFVDKQEFVLSPSGQNVELGDEDSDHSKNPSGFNQTGFSDQGDEPISPSKIIPKPSKDDASIRRIHVDPSVSITDAILSRSSSREQVVKVDLQHANGVIEIFNDIQDFSELASNASHPIFSTKFATKGAKKYFSFEDKNSIAKSKYDNWFSVTSLRGSTNGRKVGIIFNCTCNARFGICAKRFNDGYAGKPAGSWGWSCDGSEAFQNDFNYENHDLGDLIGKEIRMIYDGCNKRLTISCEGKAWIHVDSDWPTEAFFVFSLNECEQSISLQQSELAHPKRAQSELVVFKYSNKDGESYYISSQSSFEEAMSFFRHAKKEEVRLSVVDNYQTELKSLQMVKKPTRGQEDFEVPSPQLAFYLDTGEYRPMHGSTTSEAIQVFKEFDRLLMTGVTDNEAQVILAYLVEALQSKDEFEESEMAIIRVRDISKRNNDTHALALWMLFSAVSHAMLGKNDDLDLLENSLKLIPEDRPETKVRVLIKIVKRKFSKARQTKQQYEKLDINNEEQSQEAQSLRDEETKLKEDAEMHKVLAEELLPRVKDARLKLQFQFLKAEWERAEGSLNTLPFKNILSKWRQIRWKEGETRAINELAGIYKKRKDPEHMLAHLTKGLILAKESESECHRAFIDYSLSQAYSAYATLPKHEEHLQVQKSAILKSVAHAQKADKLFQLLHSNPNHRHRKAAMKNLDEVKAKSREIHN